MVRCWGVFRFDCSASDRQAAYPSLWFVNGNDRDTPISTRTRPLYTPTYQCVHGQQIVKLEVHSLRTLHFLNFFMSPYLLVQLQCGDLFACRFLHGTWTCPAMVLEQHLCVSRILGCLLFFRMERHWGFLLTQHVDVRCGFLVNLHLFKYYCWGFFSCEIDLRKESTIQFIASSSYPVITFGPFTSPTAVLVSLSHAVGTVFVPPKWSLGYHQCRWSYYSDKRVREICGTFRENGIPRDVIWMDIDYMDGFRCFTFDKACSFLTIFLDDERFPDPKSLATDLHLNGFKAIWMLDPGIKHEDGYFVYDSGSKIDVWIQKADGTPFIGEVWPGPCVFPDYTQSKSVTKTMPESNIHRGDDEIGGCQNHSYYHNVYGMLMARSTYEGMKLADKDKRTFVLTRAGFIGSQRYAATWTGDNVSNWEHLHMSISMVLQLVSVQLFIFSVFTKILELCDGFIWMMSDLSSSSINRVLGVNHEGLSGQLLSGPDIGGFAGNATPRLFGRWMGIRAMFPFCRGHSETDTIDHAPWSFGEESKDLTNCGDNPGVVPCINFKLYLLRVLKKNDVKAQPRGCLIKLYAMSIELDLRRSMVKLIAHTTGTLVASPTFFSDPEDVTLRKLENSFLLGPVLVCASTLPDQRSDKLQHALPKGIWQSFDFEVHIRYLFLDVYLYPLKSCPPHQHIGESKPSDDLTLLVALDENGKAKGVLFEDDGDGYGFTEGQYLLTHNEAELQMSDVTIRVSKSEGLWKRPKRRLIVKILLGGGAVIDTWGMDGEDLQIAMPSEAEVSNLVSASKEKYKIRMGNAASSSHLTIVPCPFFIDGWFELRESAKLISDAEKASEHKGVELSQTPIELKSGDWALKVVPWIGVIMLTGTQWLHSRVDVNGYEEYCGTEYRSAGCTEEYSVIERSLQHGGEEESLMLEGDIDGGLILQRKLTIPKDNPKIFKIDSKILACKVGAGSGGFSRQVCLRVHPMFTLLHPTESFISFTSIDGSKQEIWPESGELFYEGNLLPNGEWMLVDKCQGLALVNRFNVEEVFKCFIRNSQFGALRKQPLDGIVSSTSFVSSRMVSVGLNHRMGIDKRKNYELRWHGI
ncbi:hypothetical protein WN943_003464 [Citrus x changshan-huyou]